MLRTGQHPSSYTGQTFPFMSDRTRMNDYRKSAYRYLLYWAMLDICGVAWIRFSLWNPLSWMAEVRQIRRAGAIADWRHNLALFASIDFANFDEDRFCSDLEHVKRWDANFTGYNYRDVFQKRLSELEGEANLTIN